MTAHIITPEQHAQIIKALNIGIAKHYDLAQNVHIGDTLAMLKAMKPVSPVGWWDTIDGGDFTYSISELCGGLTDGLHPLYTPTKD